MPYVTPVEVVSRWTGADAPAATDTVLIELVEDANVLVDHQFPNLGARIAEGKLPLRIVQMTLSRAIQRAFSTAADGLSQFSYTSGPFSQSGSYAGNTDRKGGLYFTTEEATTLSGFDPNQAYSINIDPHPARLATHVWDFWESRGTHLYPSNRDGF